MQKGFLNTGIEVSLVSADFIEVAKYCLKGDLWKKYFWWGQTSLVLLGVSARYPQDSRTVRATRCHSSSLICIDISSSQDRGVCRLTDVLGLSVGPEWMTGHQQHWRQGQGTYTPTPVDRGAVWTKLKVGVLPCMSARVSEISENLSLPT